jgi:hypothetical protein
MLAEDDLWEILSNTKRNEKSVHGSGLSHNMWATDSLLARYLLQMVEKLDTTFGENGKYSYKGWIFWRILYISGFFIIFFFFFFLFFFYFFFLFFFFFFVIFFFFFFFFLFFFFFFFFFWCFFFVFLANRPEKLYWRFTTVQKKVF